MDAMDVVLVLVVCETLAHLHGLRAVEPVDGGERLLVARVLDERAALGAAGLVAQHRALLDAPERLEQPPHLLLRLRLRQHAHEQLAVLCAAHVHVRVQ